MSYSELTPRKYFDLRFSQMLKERSGWEAHWKELNRNFSPRRGRFFTEDRNKGIRRNRLYDNSPLFLKRVLRAGLMTSVTSPARPWFRLVPSSPSIEDTGEVREWLDTLERFLYRVFASGNLYQELPNLYDELIVFGTSAMLVEEDYEHIVRFQVFTAGEFMLDIDGKLNVNTFAREYEMTVAQIIDEFGKEAVTQATKQLWELGNYMSPVQIRHIIEPVSMRKFDEEEFRLPADFKWRSIYFEKGAREDEDKFLRVGGYETFPILAPRWSVVSGDTYGYSPAMDALGDAIALQVQQKEKGKAVEKQVTPPMKAPSSLRNQNVSLLPGGVTFVDDPTNESFTAIYQVKTDLQHLELMTKETTERIAKAFYADLFLMISRDQAGVRTATEITSREDEKLLQLGPVLEVIHKELLSRLIDRVTEIIFREAVRGWKGLVPMILPPPPEVLSGGELKVEFISMMANAQRLAATTSIERLVLFIGQLAQMKPEVMDLVDIDKVVYEMAEALGVPVALLKGEQEVMAVRQQRAEQQAAMEQQAQLQNASDQLRQTVVEGADAAKKMSETDVTNQSTMLGNVISNLQAAQGGGAVQGEVA